MNNNQLISSVVYVFGVVVGGLLIVEVGHQPITHAIFGFVAAALVDAVIPLVGEEPDTRSRSLLLYGLAALAAILVAGLGWLPTFWAFVLFYVAALVYDAATVSRAAKEIAQRKVSVPK